MDIARIKSLTYVKRIAIYVVMAALICGSTSAVYLNISKSNNDAVAEKFDRKVDLVKDEMKQEITQYTTLMSTIGAFFNASQSVGGDEFKEFVNGLGIKDSYPAVKGIAYAQRMDGSERDALIQQASNSKISFEQIPTGSQGEHAPLIYVDPPNAQAPTGFDTYSIPGAKKGLQEAAVTGSFVSSEPMIYVIDGKKTSGFVLAYPVVAGTPITLASNAQKTYQGWVLAFIDPLSLWPHLTSLDKLNIKDVDVKSGKTTLDVHDKFDKKYTKTFSIVIGMRERKITVTATPAFVSESHDRSKAFRYAFLVANVEIVAMLLLTVMIMHKTRRRRETSLTYQAAHDSLTGLPNRFFLEKWLSGRVANISKRQERVAVLFIDLDGFKAINDTLGHQMGDEFLIAISQRLQKEVRGRDILARLGGDEFIVVLDEVVDEVQATRIAQRLIEVIRFPVMLDSGPVCVGASIGIAITQLDASSDSNSIIRFADAAMYAAKEDKVERIRVFDHKLKSIVDGRHEVETSIRGAAIRGEIVDVLQPLVNVSDGSTFGYEALCRWNHPVFGILTPDQFLDAAKVTGEIIEIDRWMVNKAFENSISIAETSGNNTRLWVNLSVRHVLQGEFYQHMMKALRDTAASGEMIGVEIEEEVFKIDNGLLYPFLSQMRDLGISIAFDDFGSEEASLQALKRYPYDVIKLDRTLITEFAQNPSASIVPAVVEIARARDMTVVATGVESPDVLQSVIDVGCDVVQGYVFSEPRPIEELVDRQRGFRWQMPLGVNRASDKADEEATQSNVKPFPREA